MLQSRAVRTTVIVLLALCLAVAGVAFFGNGGFETGDFNGWTKATFINPSLKGAPPFNGTSIVRSAGGSDQTIIVGASAPESGVDPRLGTNASLKFPKYGTYCARVNGPATGQISNTIVQQTTISNGDIDPADGLVHIRFAYAPVLEDPAHTGSQQPYFYIRVNNVTRNNALLFESLHFSNEPGVPWKKSPLSAAVLYTDWRIADVAPGNDQLSTGDVIQLEVIGADCALGGHFGYVYVDSFGTAPLPGLTVIKRADKTQVTPGGRLTYTFTYRNSGAAGATNAIVSETLPAQTAFASVSDSRCSLAAGVVSCAIGALAPGDSGSFQLAVDVSGSAAGAISNGNYSIAADGVAPTIGPLVTTPITGAATDVAIAMTAPSSVDRPASIPYTITVRNNGPATANDVTISDSLPPTLAYVTVVASQGVCTGSSRVTCNVGTLASGATATVTLTAQPTTNGTVSNTATVSGSYPDTNSANNSATATTTVQGLTIGKTGPASAARGDLITYTLTYGNGTASAATGVILRDPLPAGTTYMSSTGGGSLANGVVTWNAGTLTAGQTQSVALTVAIDAAAAGTIRNQGYTVEATGVSPIAGPPVTTTTACSPLTIQPSALPDGTPGAIYPNTTFIASGGMGPYAFSTSGALPPGLTLSSGTLSGTPSAAGSYAFTVNASDPNGCSGSRQYTIVVKLACTPTAKLSGSVAICPGTAATIAASLTGTPPFSVTWSDGVVQSGISGTTATRTVNPLSDTIYTLASMSDSACSGSVSGSVAVTLLAAPAAAITVPPNACPSATGLIASVVDAGAGATYRWNVTNGKLTSGQGTRSITFDTGAVASGTIGTTTVSVEVMTSCLSVARVRIPLQQGGQFLSTGPEGAYFQAFAYPAGGALLAGTDTGIFKSRDGGATWRKLATTPSNPSDFAVSISNPSIVYVSAPCAGVLRSIDGGDTWTSASNGLPGCSRHVAVDAVDSDIAYTQDVQGGVFRTVNGGATWTQTSLPSSMMTSNTGIWTDPRVSRTVYSLASSALSRSVDGGVTWTALPGAPAGLNALAIDRATSWLYGGCWGSPSPVYTSHDGGLTWTQLPFPSGSDGSIMSMQVNPSNASELFALTSSYELYRSGDRGVTWGVVAAPWLKARNAFPVFAIDSTGARVIIGGRVNAFASSDGAKTWTRATGGIVNTDSHRLAFDSSLARLYAASDNNGLWWSDDAGASWVQPETQIRNTTVNSVIVTNRGELFGIADGALLRSGDNGGSWQTLPPSPLSNLYGSALAWDEARKILYWGGTGVWVSKDSGNSWTRSLNSNNTIFSLSVDPRNPSSVFAAALDGLFRTSDSGVNWSTVSGLPEAGASFVSFQATATNTVWVAGNSGSLYKSVDGGTSWSKVPYVFGPVAFDPADSNVVYAGQSNGVARSNDGGMTWNSFLPAPAGAYTILVDPLIPSRLYVGTSRSGVMVIDQVSNFSVTSITPSSGSSAGGTTLTITGIGFQQGMRVFVGGNSASSVTYVDSGKITIVTPPGSAGRVDLVIVRADCASVSAQGFSYSTPPAITSISPPVGTIAGGTSVTITGTGFFPPTTVTFGGLAATSSGSATGGPDTLIVTTPAHSAGAVDVVVTNYGGVSGTAVGGFTYSATAPTATGFSPTGGPLSGGTVVTITGTNFAPGLSVSFGPLLGTAINVVSSTTATATTPPGNAATGVSVAIRNPDGQTATAPSSFTYVGPNLMLSPSPLNIGTSGSATLTATISFALATPLTLSLTASGPIIVPATVSIPAGSTSASLSVSGSSPTGTGLITARLPVAAGGATTTLTVNLGRPPGDANGDGTVGVADVFYLINTLFAGGASPAGSGDANGDGVVTVADIFYLVNYLFAGGPAPR